MVGEEILTEIDLTLDQLIRNAEIIKNADIDNLSIMEVDAFQKTQESLIQHLLHMDECLETKRKNLTIPNKNSATSKIQEKRLKFETLESEYHKKLEKTQKTRPILSKRRGKRFLYRM